MKTRARIGFGDMNLRVGARLQIMSIQAISSTAQYALLVGFVAGDFLVLQMPEQDGEATEPTVGSGVALRVFSGASVFMFEALIEAVIRKPRSFMMVSFPTNIQKVGLRRAARAKADIPARVVNRARREAEKEAALTDISLSGALISTPNPLGAIGDLLTIEFSIPVRSQVKGREISATASIRSVQQVMGTGPAFHTVYTCGINFLHIGTAHQALLQNYVFESLLIDGP